MWDVPHFYAFDVARATIFLIGLILAGAGRSLGGQMDKNGRDRRRGKASDSANLTKVTRASAFETLDHFVGKPADIVESKAFRHF